MFVPEPRFGERQVAEQAQPLGQLDTTGLAPGDYVVELELDVPGQEPVAVQRSFTISVP